MTPGIRKQYGKLMRLAKIFVEYDSTVKDQRIKELEGLLRAAKCPNVPACDGKGTICHGPIGWPVGGEVEYDLEQCQWCDERSKALKGDE